MIRSYDDTPGLHLVDLDQDDASLVGQRRFLSCWVWATDELSFVVDPGPPSTGGRLMTALDELNLPRLDFILLTHIHLDHAGATARVLDRWPSARVVCHERGQRHLVDPARLWAGSLAVLQEKARAYGEPPPVPESALADFAEAVARGIATIPTPGHAQHHVCYNHGSRLFVGEAAGTYATLGRGCDTPEPYLRPATPPRFELEVAQTSLDRLLALDPAPKQLLFAHHGRHCGNSRRVFADAREQLGLWVETMGEIAESRGGLSPAGDETAEEDFFAQVTRALAARDPYYAREAQLPEDIRAREADFTRQTLRGMVGYLRG